MNRILQIIKHWLKYVLFPSTIQRSKIAQTFPELFSAAEELFYPVDLQATITLDLANQRAVCSSMTPQGLTLTEKYLIISAYCPNHTHHSVLYVMDRLSGIQIKTIVLPDFPHAGGLAYDPCHQKIWLSNTLGKQAAIAAICLTDIENYSDASQPIPYQEKIGLQELPRASALTYDHNYLVVALFALKTHGRIVCYPIDQVEDSPDYSLLASPTGSLAIPEKIQGVTFYKNYILFSQSWGRQAGKILIFDILQTTDFSDLRQAIKMIPTPPYLEQIFIEGDHLFALFESGAANYRQKTPFVMDHVLRIDLKILLKNLNTE